MAFSDSQKLSIARIVGITPTLLDAQLVSLGDTLTAAVETAVIAEITRWSEVADDFVEIEPNAANYGVRIRPTLVKADIVRNILFLLEMTMQMPTTMGTITVRT
jgi:hypothetical protein